MRASPYVYKMKWHVTGFFAAGRRAAKTVRRSARRAARKAEERRVKAKMAALALAAVTDSVRP